MKKTLRVLLTMILLAALMSFAAFAQSGEPSAEAPAPADEAASPLLDGEPESYGLWVGGVEVTSKNYDAITGPGITGIARYDPLLSTLTLDGVSITEGYEADGRTVGIYSTVWLCIEYLHDCSISGCTDGIRSLGTTDVFGDGTLTITSSADGACGIACTETAYLYDALTIDLSGSGSCALAGSFRLVEEFDLQADAAFGHRDGTFTVMDGALDIRASESVFSDSTDLVYYDIPGGYYCEVRIDGELTENSPIRGEVDMTEAMKDCKHLQSVVFDFYFIWVGGVQVTSLNEDNITGPGITGTVYLDRSTDALVLDNATITGGYVPTNWPTVKEYDPTETVPAAIFSPGGLTIELVGDSSISAVGDGINVLRGFETSLRFRGDGTLTISSSAADGRGVRADKLTLSEDPTVSILLDGSGSEAVDANTEIFGGTLSLQANDAFTGNFVSRGGCVDAQAENRVFSADEPLVEVYPTGYRPIFVSGDNDYPLSDTPHSSYTDITEQTQDCKKFHAELCDFYHIWVGGVPVTSANAANIVGEGIRGTVTFDSETDDLTLRDADITGSLNVQALIPDEILPETAGIFCDHRVNLMLEGDNTISNDDGGLVAINDLIVSGDGSLTIRAKNGIQSCDTGVNCDKLDVWAQEQAVTILYPEACCFAVAPPEGASLIEARTENDEPLPDSPYSEETLITEELTGHSELHLRVLRPVTLSFDMGGHGTQIAPQELLSGDLAQEPADPVADGWVFEAWFADPGFSEPFDFGVPVTENAVAYAKWGKNYSGDDDPEGSSDAEPDDGPNNEPSGSGKGVPPRTGDKARPVLWLAVLAVCGGAAAFITHRKKHP